MKYISFFSGALGLDLGLESSGFTPLLYCEKDAVCQETIKLNRPHIPLIGDINNYNSNDILNILNMSIFNHQIDLIVGGPPCQAFSTAGTRRSFEDERGNVFLHFLKIAMDLRPKYLVIENVRGLLSACYSPSSQDPKKGSALEYILNILHTFGYHVSFNLYNAANFGVPQIRERIVIIASLKSKVSYLRPTHSEFQKYGLKPWRTVKEAISGIPECKNQLCAQFPEKRLKYYKLLKSGQNWRNLPEDLQQEALGKAYNLGGGKTGFLRRLDWDKPSPTLVTSPLMPATALAHPSQDRPLSVAEYARIQEFPDEWEFAGSITDKYRQIGNAVPQSLAKAIALTILRHESKNEFEELQDFPHSRYKFTNENNWNLAFK